MPGKRRQLHYSIGPADRDPMFAGVWIGGDGSLPVSQAAGDIIPQSQAFELLPEPPPDPLMEKWKAAVDVAGVVVETMRKEFPDLDSDLLLNIIRDIVTNSLSTSDIAAIYRHRISERDDG